MSYVVLVAYRVSFFCNCHKTLFGVFVVRLMTVLRSNAKAVKFGSMLHACEYTPRPFPKYICANNATLGWSMVVEHDALFYHVSLQKSKRKRKRNNRAEQVMRQPLNEGRAPPLRHPNHSKPIIFFPRITPRHLPSLPFSITPSSNSIRNLTIPTPSYSLPR